MRRQRRADGSTIRTTCRIPVSLWKALNKIADADMVSMQWCITEALLEYVGGKEAEPGVYERPKGSGVWWINYHDAEGKRHRKRIGDRVAANEAQRKYRKEAGREALKTQS